MTPEEDILEAIAKIGEPKSPTEELVDIMNQFTVSMNQFGVSAKEVAEALGAFLRNKDQSDNEKTVR